MSRVEAESRVREVVVYARGAEVTREIAIPAGADAGPLEVSAGGVTALAEPGSFRASTSSGRAVVGVRSSLHMPAVAQKTAPADDRVAGLERARELLEAEWNRVLEWRNAAAALSPVDDLRGRSGRFQPLARARDSLAVHAVAEHAVTRLESRMLELDEALARNKQALEAVKLEAVQAHTDQLGSAPKATRDVVVQLSARSGSSGPESVLLTYRVRPARWWPAYTARITPGKSQVEWVIEAFVAQASGEDWEGVRLSVATADQVRDARLPELPSLRLGRAQPPQRSGFRAPPEGLDELFAGYDGHFTAALRDQPAAAAHAMCPACGAAVTDDTLFCPVCGTDQSRFAPVTGESRVRTPPQADLVFMDVEEPPPAPAPPAPPPPAPARSAPPPPAPAMAMRPPPGALPGSPPPAPPARAGAAAQPRGAPTAVPPSAVPPVTQEPAEQWLDFDALVLADGRDRARRGRLVTAAPIVPDRDATVAIDRLAAPRHACDPFEARGFFDHRLDATGGCDVPSDGVPHRVMLAAAAGESRPRLVSVPREAPEVYRSVELANPFDAPLLAGPVDVFLDGSFLTTTPLAAVERSGRITLGLGVEDRVRVARNSRVSETSSGMLGSSTCVEHEVTIELASALDYPLKVEVCDRIPVTDEKELKVELVPGRPAPSSYDQADRGSPVRGGLRWEVDLAPAGKATIAFSYRLTMSAKSEVIGGNRRD